MKPQNIEFEIPQKLREVLSECKGYTVARSKIELYQLAIRDAVNGVHEVAYDVPGKGRVVEARVCQVKNGIAANYVEPYMRRRDPDCMVIADDLPTDKPRFHEQFGRDFSSLREETFAWLKTQELGLFPFFAGAPGKGADALVVAPANAGFFALGLALLQGILDQDRNCPRTSTRARSFTSRRSSGTRISAGVKWLSMTAATTGTSCSATTSTRAPARRRASTACCSRWASGKNG
jgi:hypothetical protein